MEHLTISYVINKIDLSLLLLKQEEIIFDSSSPYYLVIYSSTSHFMKIHVYPIKSLPVRKYFIAGKRIREEDLQKILNLLSNMNCIILHTSGIVYKDKQNFFEIYFSGIENTSFLSISKKITQIPGFDFLHDSIVHIKESP